MSERPTDQEKHAYVLVVVRLVNEIRDLRAALEAERTAKDAAEKRVRAALDEGTVWRKEAAGHRDALHREQMRRRVDIATTKVALLEKEARAIRVLENDLLDYTHNDALRNRMRENVKQLHGEIAAQKAELAEAQAACSSGKTGRTDPVVGWECRHCQQAMTAEQLLAEHAARCPAVWVLCGGYQPRTSAGERTPPQGGSGLVQARVQEPGPIATHAYGGVAAHCALCFEQILLPHLMHRCGDKRPAQPPDLKPQRMEP